MIVAVVAAFLAGCAFAVGSVLQQRAARQEPSERSLSFGLLVDLARNRGWVLGVSLAIASFILQGVALAFGPLTLVQPIIVCELLIAVPLSVMMRRMRLHWREWSGIVVVAAGLIAFLIAASPTAGDYHPALVDWALVLGLDGVLIFGALVVGTRLRGPARATMFGLAAATAFGLQSALLKATTAQFKQSIVTGFTTWQLWVMGGVAVMGLVLGQSAFQAGPLAASLPVMDATEPIVAVLIGAFAFDEPFLSGGLAVGFQIVGLIALVGGIVALDRSPVVLAVSRQEARERPRDGGSTHDPHGEPAPA